MRISDWSSDVCSSDLAPYWDAEARGAFFGLTRATGAAEMARAALEAVCYQTRDLLEAMRADGADSLETLRVDGGMVANDWMLQMLADILGVAVEQNGRASCGERVCQYV